MNIESWMGYILAGASASLMYYFLKTIFEDHRQIGINEKLNEQRYQEIQHRLQSIDRKLEKIDQLEKDVHQLQKAINNLTGLLNHLEERKRGEDS